MLHFPDLEARLRKRRRLAITLIAVYALAAILAVFPFLSPLDGANQVRLALLELVLLFVFSVLFSKWKLHRVFHRTVTGKVIKLDAKDDDTLDLLAAILDAHTLQHYIRVSMNRQIGVLVIQEEGKHTATAITVPSIKHLDLYENGDTVWSRGDMQMPIILNRVPEILPCPLCATVFPVAHSLTCPICSLTADKT